MRLKVISFGVPWAQERLSAIEAFWNPLTLEWAVVDALKEGAEMQALNQFDASLDYSVVNRWVDLDYDLTVLCAPYVITPRNYKYEPLTWTDSTGTKSRVSVFGLQFGTCIEVFTNKLDTTVSNGIDLGNSFELWFNHELSHFLYKKYDLPDNTHLHFYSGHPENALAELKPHF